MSAYFTTEYTIHFDDTMAYGSHHFLTSFKFQCAAREAFLFGEHIFDVEGVKEELDRIHLLTSDAYSRNLQSAHLGDRVAILLTLEDWGQASARFCYRVIDKQGAPVCAGFQTLICADAATGMPIPLPQHLAQAMDAVRAIEEIRTGDSFRDIVLAGGSNIETLFGEAERQLATSFLAERFPRPEIISAVPLHDPSVATEEPAGTLAEGEEPEREAWVFAGQGAFDAALFCQRVEDYRRLSPQTPDEIRQACAVTAELLGGDAEGLFSGSVARCRESISETAELLQVAIHLQNVLGARLWQAEGHQPMLLMGHSFGEIAAFEIGGCFDLVTGVRIVCLRTLAIAKFAPPNAGLLAVLSGRHQVQTEVKLLDLDRVVVAGRNHATQTVLSGPLEQLGRLQRYLPTINMTAVPVPSPTSFHHPELYLAASHWRKQLGGLALKPPTRQIYSPIGRRFVQPDDEIADVLANQLLRPFDLQGGVADAIAFGVNRFVDCGSTGSLAKLISQSCGEPIQVGTAINDTPQQALAAPVADVPLRRVDQPHGVVPQPHRVIGDTESRTRNEKQREDRDPTAIAIVGQGCILPGGARSPEQLFEAIWQQRSGIVDQREFDPDWEHDFYSPSLVADRSTSPLSGRVNDADLQVPAGVDPEVFNQFSRAQQLLCIALVPCLKSLTDAERVLCLIGATADGFDDQDIVSSLRYAGIDPSDPAISQQLDLKRSSLASPHAAVQEVFDRIVRPGLKVTLVDAACASSLYTVALGMQALQHDKADAVIAGGCFCPGPGNSCLFSQFHGTTSTGCRPFDATADGVVFSEGAALVTLRRAGQAERLGLPIEAVIRGIGLSSDGRSPSANVPQSKGQILSLQRCYENYHIDPRSVRAIEGHGTSTAVGDSTELNTLREYFADHATQPIPVHSLKGLIGHAGWAAGTASIIASCEYLRRGIFPAQAGFCEPSAAVKESAATLKVPTEPVRLQVASEAIAIDGFGFGGANAHLVVTANAMSDSQPPTDDEDELVFVACHHVEPTVTQRGGKRFDRGEIKLPAGCVVLPELGDDMDISQKLSVILTGQIVQQLPGFDDLLRKETGLVLAMQGKTERGIEASTRIMGDRYRRMLGGLDAVVAKIDAAKQQARPSGPYTLQCMMPNVAPGRAALLHNLNGPNFVVDAGDDSLGEAIAAADLLLHSGEHGGARLVIVSAIAASSSAATAPMDECAAAFAITTRRFAESKGWSVLSSVNAAREQVIGATETGVADASIDQQAKSLLRSLGRPVDVGSAASADRAASASVAESEPHNQEQAFASSEDCQLHVPVWVEQALPGGSGSGRADQPHSTPMLFIAPANETLVSELVSSLPNWASDFLIAVVGQSANRVVQANGDRRLLSIDLSAAESLTSAWDWIDNFQPASIVAVDQIGDWDPSESLTQLATDNSLCEFMFLVAQHHQFKISEGQLDLWGLFVDGYDGRVHAKSGAVAGLLKSVRREIPAARVGCLCTRGLNVSAAIGTLLNERQHATMEPEMVQDGAVRMVRRLRPVAIDSSPAADCRATDRAATSLVSLDEHSVVIATGGAKGVTAIMLEALLRDYQCTVVALGRSRPEPGPKNPDDPEVEQAYYRQFLAEHPGASALEMKRRFQSTRATWEADRQLQELRAIGGRVEYMVADVTDRDQVDAAIEQVLARFGNVDLVIHGAGIQLSKKLQDRTLAEFQRTFATKVKGLANLTSALQERLGRTVATHVLTSAYSLFGNDGQHDYGAANESMDRACAMTWGCAMTQCNGEPQCSAKTQSNGVPGWSSIAWLAWDSIGMTRGSEYRILAQQRGLSGVKPDVGQRLFREVLSGRTGAAINVPITDAEHLRYRVATVPARETDSGLAGRLIESEVRLSDIDCLPFHKVRNTPTLPGAWILDRMVGAAMQLLPDRDAVAEVTVSEMTFMRFVRFVNGQEPNLRVIAEQTDGGFVTWMVCDVLHPTGQVLAKDVICAKAFLSFSGADQMLRLVRGQSSIANGFAVDRFTPDPYCEGRDREVDLSGPFHCLREIKIGVDGRGAKYVPQADFRSQVSITALLLDAAWRVAAIDAVPGSKSLFVPVKIDRMVIPAGPAVAMLLQTPWEIRSTTPVPVGADVGWSRTEVLDRNGTPRLIVENGFAKRIT